MSDLQIQKKQSGAITVLQITGKLDAKTAPTLSGELKGLIGTGHSKIICDLTGVTYIASAGVGTLKAGLVDAKKNGGDLRLANPKKEVLDVLEVLGFARLFTIAADVNHAAQGL